jgi:hypothetical protein
LVDSAAAPQQIAGYSLISLSLKSVMHTTLAVLFSVMIVPALVAAQDTRVRIVGRVVANEGNEPIAGAVVRVGSTQYTTDQRGQFLIPLLASVPIEMTVEMIGYAARTDSLKPSAGTNDVLIRLSRSPVRLPPLSVSVRSAWLEETGFYERRLEAGISGHFIDRAQIEKRNPTFLTDLFFGVPGTKVHTLGMSQRVVQFSRSESGGLSRPQGQDERVRRLMNLPGCQPYVYLDGRRHADILETGRSLVLDFNIINPDAIEAVEVYVGAATPPQFRNENGCGVLLIWTRRGR